MPEEASGEDRGGFSAEGIGVKRDAGSLEGVSEKERLLGAEAFFRAGKENDRRFHSGKMLGERGRRRRDVAIKDRPLRRILPGA